MEVVSQIGQRFKVEPAEIKKVRAAGLHHHHHQPGESVSLIPLRAAPYMDSPFRA